MKGPRTLMVTPATEPAIRDAAHGLLAADGQPVIVINDSPGFVAQRVVAMIVNIGCGVAQRGIATPADIDKGTKLGLGYPFGPIEWGDRIGAKRVLFILERLHAFYGEPRYRPNPWLKRRAMLGLAAVGAGGARRLRPTEPAIFVPCHPNRRTIRELRASVSPAAIAIIGASADLTRIGGHPIKALKGAGYKGGIFLVNPKYPEMHGLKCYPDAVSIGAPCDLAIVAVPAPGVAQAIRDCGKASIPFAVVLTAGFRETGAEGRKLEDELKRAIAESGVRIVGPNCQGMLSIQSRVWAAFGSVADETDFRPGTVSCAFQSGGFGYAVVNLAEAQGIGFRICVSSGNETDIDMPAAAVGVPR